MARQADFQWNTVMYPNGHIVMVQASGLLLRLTTNVAAIFMYLRAKVKGWLLCPVRCFLETPIWWQYVGFGTCWNKS